MNIMQSVAGEEFLTVASTPLRSGGEKHMKKKSSPTRRVRKPVPAAQEKSPASQAAVSFPIIGIGASAGGFEALEQFISNVPKDSGMAFVIVQHLDPTRKGLMPELLQRCTPMNVMQVKDRTRVRPDCVYVIPPNKNMSILHGVLHLFEPSTKRGQRLPIDFFLCSLALDQQQNAIGVILSGMGSDGTPGQRAIREKGGLAVAQEPSTAKFDSMPRSVIDAGLADIVAPADELPGRIMVWLKHAPHAAVPEAAVDSSMRGALEKILILMRSRTGHDFSYYKKNTLYRRIERRMGIHQIEKIASYVRFLNENPDELDLLFRELLIGVTGFFRDPDVWQLLREKTLPELLAHHPTRLLRAWVAGCSTGEEAYTLAIVFREVVEKLKPGKNFKLQIFATDLDRDAIDKARQGVFSDKISADLTPELLRRYFTEEEGGYRVRAAIREMVIFSPHSVIKDPPFTKLDILSCRNLLIYLAPEIQQKLFPLFHYSLTPGGLLILGNAETIGHFSGLFATVSGKSRIYQRLDSVVRLDPIEFPSSFSPAYSAASDTPDGRQPIQNLQTQIEQLLLRRYAPPSVLVNESGNIIHISGKTGKYLEPAAGKANLNVFAMARDGLRHELTSAFQKALRQTGPVTLRGLKIGTNGGSQHADLIVERLEETEPLAGLVIIVFCDIEAPVETKTPARTAKDDAKQPRLAELERELRQNREELRNTREQMQTTQEELRSSNEEMQSTNEEMQSTNEELTTSKEEMQSLNEELQTVNAELQGRLDELSLINNDMRNLLNSTEVATVFLDKELKIRRFTTQAVKITTLIPGDVGRPISDIACELLYPGLSDDSREVLRKLGAMEKPIRTSEGSWFSARIMPYRTMDDRIDGVVISYWDITTAKELEAKLQEMQLALENRLAGKSTELDKAQTELKAERKRTTSVKPRKT
jgi:two-component system, chemotaxis family, CheB/CheR fusion protein